MRQVWKKFTGWIGGRSVRGAFMGLGLLAVGVPSCVVMEVVRPEHRNTATFRVSAYDQPQIAQSFVVPWGMDVEEVRFGVSYVMTVAPENLQNFFSASIAEKAKYYVTRLDYGPMNFDVTIDFYRATTGDHLADDIDLSQGFEKFESVSTNLTVPRTMGTSWSTELNAKVPLGKTVKLDPATYVIVLSFDWDTPELFQFWMMGRESGTNLRLRPDQSGELSTTCSYAPSADIFTTGRAYYGIGDGRGWDGTSNKRGWGTRFRFATAKVSACTDMTTGQAGGVWNQGDLALNLVGRFHS